MDETLRRRKRRGRVTPQLTIRVFLKPSPTAVRFPPQLRCRLGTGGILSPTSRVVRRRRCQSPSDRLPHTISIVQASSSRCLLSLLREHRLDRRFQVIQLSVGELASPAMAFTALGDESLQGQKSHTSSMLTIQLLEGVWGNAQCFSYQISDIHRFGAVLYCWCDLQKLCSYWLEIDESALGSAVRQLSAHIRLLHDTAQC